MKNTAIAFEKKTEVQEELLRLIRQIRRQRTSSVMDLKKSNSDLFDQFSSALYYFFMPTTEDTRAMLSDLVFEKKFASLPLSAHTGALLSSLRTMGMSPEDCMSDTWLWLFSEFSGKSKKYAGRLRIDVILDAGDDYVLPTLYLSVNNHLCDLLKKKSPCMVPLDEPAADGDTLTLAELLFDDTQLMENASDFLRETNTVSKILKKSELSAPEKLCMLLLALGCEMPKSMQSFAKEISPEALRNVIRANCPSLDLDRFPLEEALCDLRHASSKRISELKRSGIRALKNKNFQHSLQQAC